MNVTFVEHCSLELWGVVVGVGDIKGRRRVHVLWMNGRSTDVERNTVSRTAKRKLTRALRQSLKNLAEDYRTKAARRTAIASEIEALLADDTEGAQ